MSNTVLVVEDDEETRRLLARSLRRSGLSVLTACGGAEGLEMIQRHRPRVIVLDLVMPDVSGEVVCAAVRADPEIAQLYILMLTGLATDEDRLAGFKLGADDYVTKPCNVREIVLRVRAALRRLDLASQSSGGDRIAVGSVFVDRIERRVFIGTREFLLTPSEHAILLALASRPGRLLSREDLARAVSKKNAVTDPRRIDCHVRRLRRKLGAEGRILETVRGSGYRISELS